MNTYESMRPRTFYRCTDRAVLGGVCAGLSEYFGFNLRVLRVLAVIAFFVAMPAAVIVYLALVFLIPARAGNGYEAARPHRTTCQRRKDRRAARKQAQRKAAQSSTLAADEVAAQVRSKCQVLEQRLANLEKYITSSRYQLDKEFSRL
jgi:phage shock protein C